MSSCDWQAIRSAPRGRLVEVAGDSGYRNYRWFTCLAVLEDKYREGEHYWRGVDGDLLEDRGWHPIAWREATHPKCEPDRWGK
jgi:hypothetical protein